MHYNTFKHNKDNTALRAAWDRRWVSTHHYPKTILLFHVGLVLLNIYSIDLLHYKHLNKQEAPNVSKCQLIKMHDWWFAYLVHAQLTHAVRPAIRPATGCCVPLNTRRQWE